MFEQSPVVVLQVQYRTDDLTGTTLLEPLYDITVFDVTRGSVTAAIFVQNGTPRASTVVVGMMAFISGSNLWDSSVQSTITEAIVAQSGTVAPSALPGFSSFTGNCGFPLLFANHVESSSSTTADFYTIQSECDDGGSGECLQDMYLLTRRNCLTAAANLSANNVNTVAFETSLCESATDGSLNSEPTTVEPDSDAGDSTMVYVWLMSIAIGGGVVGVASAYLYMHFTGKLSGSAPPETEGPEEEASATVVQSSQDPGSAYQRSPGNKPADTFDIENGAGAGAAAGAGIVGGKAAASTSKRPATPDLSRAVHWEQLSPRAPQSGPPRPPRPRGSHFTSGGPQGMLDFPDLS